MAVLKLQRREDLGELVDELSLYGYEDNIAVAEWIPGAENEGAPVTEAMTLRIKGSNATNLDFRTRSSFNHVLADIDDKIQQVKLYRDASERYSVWLYNQTEGEPGYGDWTRRAFILSLAGQPALGYHDQVATRHDFMNYTLVIERAPHWELTTPWILDYTSTGPSGGITAPTAQSGFTYVPGTAPGRIAKVAITSPVVASANRIWMGLRSYRFGNPYYFDGDWNIGSVYHALGADTSKSGDDVVCDFGTNAAMADRAVMLLQDAVPSPAEMRGEYQVLLLAKVGASTVCHVQLKDGWHGTVVSGVEEYTNAHQRTRVDTTVSRVHNLGTIRIPPSRGQFGGAFMDKFAITLAAQRTSGTGSLTMEKVMLVPRNEGYLFIDNVLLSSAITSSAEIYSRPEGTIEGYYMRGSGAPDAAAVVDAYNWSFPPGEIARAFLVVVADVDTGFNTSVRLNVKMYVYPGIRTTFR